MQIVKAENLGAMLRAFKPGPLKEDELSKFYYENTMAIRTGDPYRSPLKNLFKECTTPSERNAHLLLGHRGCGKSTELYNLKRQFEKADQPVFISDVEIETDLFQVNCWDFMLLITEGLCTIAQNNNVRLPDETLQSVFDYINKGIVKIDTNEGSAGIAMEAGLKAETPSILSILKIFASIKSDIKVNTSTRTVVTETMQRRASEWVRYIYDISAIISQKLDGKQPILIFENVDKMQPPEKAFDIFSYSILAQMPFPIIYTFPISLSFDPRYSSIKDFYKPHVLPMIKVSNINGSENEEGIEAIREIVKLRADEGLFDKGDTDADGNDALTLLIKQTGGVLRDLFSCIVVAALRADDRGEDKISVEDAERALVELSSELTKQITRSDYDKLANIYSDPDFKDQIEDKKFLLEKMQALVVLEYNGDRWYGLHPLVAKYLKKHGVI